VSGWVQGVGYRASARARASSLGVDGWARNLGDGRVEIVAEGPTDRVAAFLDWCRSGPAGARVTTVEVTDEEPAGEPPGFHVARG
jgi:acylphosphatase